MYWASKLSLVACNSANHFRCFVKADSFFGRFILCYSTINHPIILKLLINCEEHTCSLLVILTLLPTPIGTTPQEKDDLSPFSTNLFPSSEI